MTRSHGKGLRPTLTLLCAKLGGNPVSDNAIRAAVIVELLHEATLVHDDVVDESSQRRGFPSLSSKFKNKISVLYGDYMLANALTETLDARDFQWLDILSTTAKRMAKGELVQAARTRKLNITENEYLEMIGNKTAALFSACCQLGGISGGLEIEQQRILGEFGRSFGITFQIRDDILDLFGKGMIIGKPTGGDLKERKLTLPLLGAFQEAPSRETRRVRARIRRGVKKRDISVIIDFITKYKGLDYAEDVMNREAEHAISKLEQLPESSVRNILQEMVIFALSRKK
ncbi:polyprenyl synthetase family protein [bacterium]|nr:polyprenyl synthetase family protein [bacterium]